MPDCRRFWQTKPRRPSPVRNNPLLIPKSFLNMKSSLEFITIRKVSEIKVPATLVLLPLFWCSATVFSQTVVAPVQPASKYQPQVTQQSTEPLTNAITQPAVPTFLQWGPVTAHPRASYRYVSSTGVQYKPGSATDTTIQTLSPGILLGVGTHWSLDYQASWNFYSSREFKDTLDHAINLLGSAAYENWTFNLSQGFSRSSQSLVETGRQTQQDQYSTGFTALDRIDSHLILETVGSQSLTSPTDFNDTKEWSLLEWLHFRFSQQLDTALGAGAGYVEVNNGADANYYKFLGRIDWRPGSKLNLHLDGGLDHRRIRTGSANYINNPIANASVGYKLFEHTILMIGATRTVTASYFSNQTQKNLSWNAALDQRLLGRINLNLSAGYQKSTYEQTALGDAAARNDNNHWYDVRLSTVVLRRGSVSIFYHRGKNSSSTPGYGFTSDQYGTELRYQY